MRIAELAIPTKRQCLDTWRHRGNTLPNFMVGNNFYANAQCENVSTLHLYC